MIFVLYKIFKYIKTYHAGGAGLRVEQYFYHDINTDGTTPITDLRLKSDYTPSWWYGGPCKGYIPDIQSGWGGPIGKFYY